MERFTRQQIWLLPNLLSVVRILAIPIILLLLFSPGRVYQTLTALLFLLVGITDTLDGFFARRRGMVTTLGQFLDPLADKLLIATVLIALILARGIPLWMVIVIVGREIAVTGLRGIAMARNLLIPPSTMGKYKTAFEVASVTLLIYNGTHSSVSFYHVGIGLLWVALALAIISGIDYFIRFFKSVIVSSTSFPY